MNSSRAMLLLAASATLAIPGHAHAETTVATATSPWKLDNTGNSCRMQRGFGTAEAPVLLQIEQLAPGDWFALTVAARGFAGINADSRVTLSTAPEVHDPISTRFTLGDLPTADGKTLTTLFFRPTTLNGFGKDDAPPPRVTPEREGQVTSLIVAWGGHALQVGTGPLAKSFAAMRSCTSSLVASWGLDPAQQAALSRRPKPQTPPSHWLSRSSYPTDLAQEGKAALVDVRLMIDSAGIITSCNVVNGYSDPRFAKVTCDRIVANARFEPALDAAGNPVASYAVQRVRWMIEDRPLPRVIRPRRR